MPWNRRPESISCSPWAWTSAPLACLRRGRVGGVLVLGALLGYSGALGSLPRSGEVGSDRPLETTPVVSSSELVVLEAVAEEGVLGAVEPPPGSSREVAVEQPWQLLGVETVGVEAVSLEAVGVKAVGVEAVGMQAVGGEAVGVEAVGGEAVGVEAVGVEAVGVEAVGVKAVGVETVGVETVDASFGQRSLRSTPPVAPRATPRSAPTSPVSQSQAPHYSAMNSEPGGLGSTLFYDVPENYWAEEFIVALVHRSLVHGFPDGSFRPNAPLTRAQFAVLLAQAFPGDRPRDRSSLLPPFQDLSPQHWAASAVAISTHQGFLKGYPNGQFQPDRSLSRLEVLLALAAGLNYVPGGPIDRRMAYYNDYALVPFSAWNAIAAVTERRVVVSYPDPRFLNPNRPATRAEVAAVLYQALVSEGKAMVIPSPYIVNLDPTTLSLAPALSPPASPLPTPEEAHPDGPSGDRGYL